jgi:5-methylcytosine-specific restriction endonuclease McrA
MRNLVSFPSIPPHIEYLVLIRNAKRASGWPNHKALLIAKHKEIVSSYGTFVSAIQKRDLESVKPNKALASVRDSLVSCYTNKSAGIKKLKNDIRTTHGIRVLKYCPMCGITSPSTFDHYLPSSRYPEFAVHPLNLIPCCSICNSTKNDDWLNKDDRRQYLHLYSDLIPASDFLGVYLHAPVTATGVGATFRLTKPKRVRTQDWRLIESHFTKLKLLDRYAEQSNAEIAEILESCAEHVTHGGLRPKQFLLGIANRQVAVYGSSSWRVQLMRKLAGSPKFLELISKQ